MPTTSSPLQFHRPRPMPADGFYPHQVVAHINSLRQFIGPERLTQLVASYRATQGRMSGVEIFRMREEQPLIEGFEAYRRASLGYRRTLKHIGPDLHSLANIAANYFVVAPTLPGDLAAHQRDKMVNFDGQLAPQLLEWTTAANLSHLPGCEIAWYPVHATGPEFAVRSNGLEWEMECKRLSPMVVELLGESEAAKFAGRVLDFLHRQGWQGQVDMVVPVEQPNRAVSQDIESMLKAIDFSIPLETILPNQIRLRARLKPKVGIAQPVEAWQAQVDANKQHDSRVYAMGRANGDTVIDPLVLQLAGPQKTADQLVEELWAKKFHKAASQCTGNRAAGLVFEWKAVGDPRVFQKSELMQALMRRTFAEFKHVAFIAMRCVQPPRDAYGSVDFSVPGYSAISNVTPFPEVAALLERWYGRHK